MDDKKIVLETIFNKTGIYITTKNDCRLISQLIANEKAGFLSESTLYRFFLYHDNTNKPYKNTYNVLAKFCGYPDWNTFIKYYDSNYLYNEPNFLNNSIDTVIKCFVVHENFKPLIDVFDTLENENYKTKEFFGVKTFLNFQKTTSFPKFIKEFGRHNFVREILIESLFDPYHRMNGYAESIEYYMNATDKNSNDYIRDLIFTQSVLFRHYYLTSNQKAQEYGKKLYDDPYWETSIEQLHVFPQIRFMAYKFWYLKLAYNSKTQQKAYSVYFKNWLQNEIEKKDTVHELNIMYHTTKEVLLDLKLHEFNSEIKQLFQAKISSRYNHALEFDKLYNPNGITSILPL
jgi:hypothetical protein